MRKKRGFKKWLLNDFLECPCFCSLFGYTKQQMMCYFTYMKAVLLNYVGPQSVGLFYIILFGVLKNMISTLSIHLWKLGWKGFGGWTPEWYKAKLAISKVTSDFSSEMRDRSIICDMVVFVTRRKWNICHYQERLRPCARENSKWQQKYHRNKT